MEIDRGLEFALEGEAVLFLGAGFSKGAVNLRSQMFKTGPELARHFSTLAGLHEDLSLPLAAEEFLECGGVDQFIDQLKHEFTVGTVSNSQMSIASIPWKRVYTTNYDDVFENASSRGSKACISVTTSDDIRKLPKTQLLCVHLCGYVHRLDRDNVRSECLLSESAFLSHSLSDSGWAAFFRNDLKNARSVFFVGYSVGDLDISRLLAETLDLKEKTFFIVGADVDRATQRRATRFGQLTGLDNAGFAQLLDCKKATYVPAEDCGYIGTCFEKFSLPDSTSPFSDKLVFDLLFQGSVQQAAVVDSMSGGPEYFLERSMAEEVLRSIEHDRIAVVTSEIANGKTLLIEGIKCRAADAGYEVYVARQKSEHVRRELEQIFRSQKRILLVVEDYPAWWDLIRDYWELRPETAALLLSARSSRNDVNIESLYQAVGTDDLAEVSIDHLSDSDIDWLVKFFERYGLWGEKAAWSPSKKRRFLTHDCSAQFQGLLLHLLDSPQLAVRLKQIISQIDQKKDHYRILLTILALTVLNYPVSLNTLLDIWGSPVLDSSFRRNPVVVDLVDFHAGAVRLRSSATAQCILKRVADVHLTVETLVKLFLTIDKIAWSSPWYHQLLTSLMRFSEVQSLLPEKEKRPAIISYYERIKNSKAAHNNPLFWLQYAIACLVIGEYERAEKYFQTSYSFAREGDWDTYQIDNHFSRFLLVTAVERDDVQYAMRAFRQARQIINRQVSEASQRFHYPYRVATAYADFYRNFDLRLGDEEREEVRRAMNFIVSRIQKLPPTRRQQRYVSKCYDSLTRIIGSSSADPEPKRE